MGRKRRLPQGSLFAAENEALRNPPRFGGEHSCKSRMTGNGLKIVENGPEIASRSFLRIQCMISSFTFRNGHAKG